ncbi:MAG: hypothetical protein AABX76_00520 [Nanoarchaeota archaeon]
MTILLEDFMRTATDEQLELLHNLNETAEQEQILANRVNAIYGSLKSRVHTSGSIGVGFCEDEDDARVISAGPTHELKRVRGQMKGYMQRAVQIGMGNLGIIERNYEGYVGAPLSK